MKSFVNIALIYLVAIFTLNGQSALEPWAEGFLDIHHINTGRGDAAFLIFPDGTTMMFDVGASEGPWIMKPREPHEMKITPVFPNDSLRPGQWIGNYLKQVWPKYKKMQLDYAVISHFHGDHFGSAYEESPSSKTGAYKLSGITDLYDIIPIKKIIDRDYPHYDFPIDLKEYHYYNFRNYLDFIQFHQKESGLSVEKLDVGSSSQIKTKKGVEDFFVLGVKTNGIILDKDGKSSTEYFTKDMLQSVHKDKVNENPLSIAITVNYGKFDYYTGGDNTGVATRIRTYGMQDWWDVETPMAKTIGEVDVATMNHHGVRDAMNSYFVNTLRPQIFVQQSHTSDHPGQEAFYRMRNVIPKPDFFATNIHNETKVTYGWWFTDDYKSMHGHILVRVFPGGDKFEVIILDHLKPKLEVKEVFGPYYSKD